MRRLFLMGLSFIVIGTAGLVSRPRSADAADDAVRASAIKRYQSLRSNSNCVEVWKRADDSGRRWPTLWLNSDLPLEKLPMLTVYGTKQSNLCGGLSRRSFLRIGGLGMAGLSLADLLRFKARGEVRPEARGKSVIMIYLPGGPSHIDMYDMKPDAPAEYRGEFKPMRTNVPGIDICEYMPRQARIADKLAIVRGLKTFAGGGNHDAYELLTSDPRPGEKIPANPLPAFGSVVSKIRSGNGSGVPPYVGIKDLHMLVPSTARPARING